MNDSGHNYTFGMSLISKSRWDRAFGKTDTVSVTKAYPQTIFGFPVIVSGVFPIDKLAIIKADTMERWKRRLCLVKKHAD